jgi:hypothetical protein
MDQRCLSCEGNQCKACDFSYLENGKCVKPLTSIQNCLTYKKDGECSFCLHGYHLKDNKCLHNVIENCAEENAQGMCIMCKKGIKIKAGVCLKENKCETPNCDYCAEISRVDMNVEVCQICDEDYAIQLLPDGLKSCVKETNLVQNCMVLAENGKCKVCRFGHYWNHGTCEEADLDDVTDDISSAYIPLSLVGFLSFLFL